MNRETKTKKIVNSSGIFLSVALLLGAFFFYSRVHAEVSTIEFVNVEVVCDQVTPIGPAIDLDWTDVSGVWKYNVYRNGKFYTNTMTDSFFYNSAYIIADNTYTYKIEAVNSSNVVIAESDVISVTANASVCNSGNLPGSFTLSYSGPVCNSGIPIVYLDWTVSSGATTYEIYKNGAYYTSTTSTELPASVGLVPGNTYSYYVKAINSYGSTSADGISVYIPFDVCITPCTDNDNDGYCSDVDCNDWNRSINPGATEVCGDNVDNNCNQLIDEGCSTEGYCGDGVCKGEETFQTCETDCGFCTPSSEICDGIDNDCDGYVDENLCWNSTSLSRGANSLVVNPVTHTTLYAGTHNGVYISIDSGDNWNMINSGLSDEAVYSIAINPIMPNILYAGTNGDGIYKSTNNGNSWNAINTGLNQMNVYSIAIDPFMPTTLYATGSVGFKGIYKSTNGGNSWNAINTGLNHLSIYSLAIDSSVSTTLYAGTNGGGVYKSTNGGDSWNAINTGLNHSSIYSLAVDPSISTTLYAGTNGGVYKSIDGGDSWQVANGGLNSTTHLRLFVDSIAIDPSVSTTLYAGTNGGGVYKSTNGGDSWKPINAVLDSGLIRSLVVAPLTPTTIYMSTSVGVYKYVSSSDLPPCSDGIDNDGDGFGVGCVLGEDCNDNDASRWRLDYFYIDNDEDGYIDLSPMSNNEGKVQVCYDIGIPDGYLDNMMYGEDCDDSNPLLNVSCEPTQECGNGIVEEGEECDGEEGVQDGYICTDTCTLEEFGGSPTVSNVLAIKPSTTVEATYDVSDNSSAQTEVSLVYDSGATLVTAIDNIETTSLEVSDISNFPTSGTILLQHGTGVETSYEYLDYTSISGNYLEGITRSTNNTLPYSHPVGTMVYLKAQTVTGDHGTVINGIGKTLTWDPTSENNFYQAIQTIGIVSNNGASTNKIGVGFSSAFEFDSVAPVVNGAILDEIASPAQLTFDVSDDTALEMMISLEPDFDGASWEVYSTSPTIALADSPDTVYVKFKDSQENTTVQNVLSDVMPILETNEVLSYHSWVGTANTTPMIVDPINSVFGNYIYTAQDINIPDRGLSFLLNRTYNSHSKEDGFFGHRWTYSYNIKLNQYSNGIAFVKANGQWDFFEKQLDGSFKPTLDVKSQLSQKEDGSFIIDTKNNIEYRFNGSGKILSVSDAYNNVLFFIYNDEGRLSKVISSSGRELVFSYNSDGKIVSAIDPAGRAYEYSYDINGNLSSYTNPIGGNTQYEYDENHNLAKIIDPNGNVVVKNDYDDESRVVSQTDGKGNTGMFSYNTDERVTVYTNSQGDSEEYHYDDSYRVFKRVDALGGEVISSFDDSNCLISKTNQNGEVAYFDYDEEGNLFKRKDALGNTTLFSYDNDNNLISTTDPLGNTIYYEYNQEGSIVKTTNPLGGEITISYDEYGLPESITDSLDATIEYSYDEYGNLITITDQEGEKMSFLYDDRGNILKRIDQDENIVDIEYDPLNRVKRVTNPLENSIIYEYDGLKNKKRIIDPYQNETYYEYDENNNLVQVKDANGGITQYKYDKLNNLIQLLNAENEVIRYERDALGRVIKTIDPLGNEKSYVYDGVGNIISIKNTKGDKIWYFYDANGKLVEKTLPDGSKTSFEYDSVGNILKAENEHVAYSYTYDALGRRTSSEDSRFGILEYEYDLMGNKKSLNGPSNLERQYEHDSFSRLMEITDEKNRKYNFSYNNLHQRTNLNFPNNTSVDYQYDSAGQLSSLITMRGEHELDSFFYNYDKRSNRVSQKNGQQSTEYEYDNLSQLLSAITQNENTSNYKKNEKNFYNQKRNEFYTYDSVGNRLSGPKEEKYYYNEANELLSVSFKKTNQLIDLSYDNNGNIIKKEIDKDGIWEYDFNEENKLLKVTHKTKNNKTMEAEYVYDPFGRRLEKRVYDAKNKKTKIEQFLYDGEDILAIYNEDKKPLMSFVHGPGIDEPLSVSQYEKQQSPGDPKVKTYYYTVDGLGSIIGLTNEAGEMIQKYRYDSFGNMEQIGENIQQPYTYTAREYDKESGLYYYRARYYDPEIGRFIGRDPLFSVNRYSYVENNPMSLIDPTGMCSEDYSTSAYQDFAAGLGENKYGDWMMDHWYVPGVVLSAPLAIYGVAHALPAVGAIGTKIAFNTSVIKSTLNLGLLASMGERLLYMGVATETGSFILTYSDLVWEIFDHGMTAGDLFIDVEGFWKPMVDFYGVEGGITHPGSSSR